MVKMIVNAAAKCRKMMVKIDKIKEELADIINYAFLIAYKYNLDIKDIVLTKLKRNAEKYPIDKAKGCAKKYSEL